MALQVYFEVEKDLANSGTPAIYVTKKAFYDKHKCYDDRVSKTIDRAMTAAGFSYCAEALYAFPNDKIMSNKEIIEALSPHLEMIPLENAKIEQNTEEDKIRSEIIKLCSFQCCQFCEEKRMERLHELIALLPDEEYDDEDDEDYYDEDED